MKLQLAYLFPLSIVGALTLATCSATDLHPDIAERRSTHLQRVQDGQAYSEFLQARYAALTNDPDHAAGFYTAAAKNEPYDKELLERATFSSLIAADVETAIRTARNAPGEARFKTALPNLVLAVDALSKNRPRQATSYLGGDTGSRFNDLIASSLKAWAVYDTSGLEAGLAELSAIEGQTSLLNGLAGVSRGMMLVHANQEAEALTTFEAMWDEGVKLASTTEIQAILLARQGDTDTAIDRLETFRGRIGQNASISRTLGVLKTGDIPDLRDFSISQGAALSVYTAAAALSAQTGSDLAGVYFALALHLDPELHIARTLWADALDDADRRKNAITLLEEVPETSVFYSTAQGQLAWILRREGRNKEALETAIEALERGEDRNLRIQIGDLLRSLDELEKSEAIFSEIIEEDAAEDVSDWRLLYARGALREQLGNWSEAERDLLAALELAPRQPALLNYLGYSWIDRGERLEESLDMIKRAALLRPNAGFIIDSLGWAHYKLGDYDQAVEHLERAVSLSPSEAALNDHLGDAYWQVGRKTEARYQWARVLRIDPDYETASDVTAKLEAGLAPPR